MLFRIQIFLLICFALVRFVTINAQTQQAAKGNPSVIFAPHPEQVYGFDAYTHEEWKNNYEEIKIEGDISYRVSNKSIGEREGDKVNAIFLDFDKLDKRQLRFLINDSIEFTSLYRLNDSTFTLLLPFMIRITASQLVTKTNY